MSTLSQKIQKPLLLTLLALFLCAFSIFEFFSLTQSRDQFARQEAQSLSSELSTTLGIINSALQSGDLVSYQSALSRFRSLVPSFRANPYVAKNYSTFSDSLSSFDAKLIDQQSFFRDLLELRASVTLLTQQTSDFSEYSRQLSAFRSQIASLSSPELATAKQHFLDYSAQLLDLANNLIACENICATSVYEEKRAAFTSLQTSATEAFAPLEETISNQLQLSSLILALSSFDTDLSQ